MQVIRELSYVYAAVAPEHGLMTSLILPYATTEMLNRFLAQVARDAGRLFRGHASRSSRLAPGQRVADPRKSPLDLSTRLQSQRVNPAEHLWEEWREKYLHNLVFPSLEDLIECLAQALAELTKDTQRLRSMMFFPQFKAESQIVTW
jgi:hypothetical protein